MVQLEIRLSMTQGGKLFRRPTSTKGALFAALWPFLLITWKNNISLEQRVFIMTLKTPLGSSVTNAIPLSPAICNLGA